MLENVYISIFLLLAFNIPGNLSINKPFFKGITFLSEVSLLFQLSYPSLGFPTPCFQTINS